MSYGKIDNIDLVSLVLLPLAAGVELGVWTLSLNSLFPFSFSDTVFSIGGTPISLAMIGALASIGALFVTGQLDGNKFRDEEWYVIAGSIAALPVYRFVPAFQNLIDGIPLLAFTLWLMLSGAAVYISYKG